MRVVGAPLSISIFSYAPYTPAEKAEIEKAKAEAIKTGKYEAVFIDHIAENSGIID